MPNRLADARSPYLLQHKDNPVDWYPWGKEALDKAREENKPIFLSIGYAACHWCHVMEHESFENEAIAAQLNEHFVCIKVDREERPDIDQIYMNAVQMMTGQGGWPMSVFLTPDRKPFFAGTYWPPEPRAGMPGFPTVIEAVADAWENRQADAHKFANDITESLQEIAGGPSSAASSVPPVAAIDQACQRLIRVHDDQWGGFGQAPKFPHVSDLDLLLRFADRRDDAQALAAVRTTLDKMAAGGIYDHLGGGFARYSVDERWLVPHFEKMLYDNGGLARLYLNAFQLTGHRPYADVADQTLNYLVRDMTDSGGGLHSSEDADSEGEEGKFYVWSPDEIIQVLGQDRGRRFAQVYDVTAAGNFEGHSILNRPVPLEELAQQNGWDLDRVRRELAEDREKLRVHRDRRIHPGRDDKVLTSWNALAIEALAVGSGVLQKPEYAQAAERAASFLWDTMRSDDGRLLHAYRDGHAHLMAYLDDYAYTIEAFIALYEATGRARWIQRATALAEQMIEHYQDDEGGGFFYTADDGETLISRTKDWHDNSIPSSNGSAAAGLLRLGRLTGNEQWIGAGERTLLAGGEVIEKQYAAAAKLLLALDFYHHGNRQIVVSGPTDQSHAELLGVLYRRFLPHSTLGIVTGEPPQDGPLVKLLGGKQPQGGQPTLYVCQNYTCDAPQVGDEALAAAEQL
ncbi:thioredoxin domain-containing protein [Roseimaritima sediminicola]|uniref:thioredoxin domain-containing protein n=1 Tax=Roseimaritima sediminicola TaxID=2662066 RepID=UPI0012983257|nr:thioredoxin domain-containing protein [Roseimaritima sediminicola]